MTEKKYSRSEWALRLLLAAYFLIFCYVVAQGMFPLPDETPRIKYWDFAFSLLSLVIGFQMLISKYRGFLLASLLFLPFASWHLQTRAKFLEMMLESFRTETLLRYGLIGVALLLATPWSLRAFSKPASEFRNQKPMLFKEGLPY